MGKLHSLEEKVRSIMILNHAARDNDILLVVEYYSKYCGIYSLRDILISKSAPAPESISRARRKIQASGRCLPSKEAKKAREEEETKYKEYARS